MKIPDSWPMPEDPLSDEEVDAIVGSFRTDTEVALRAVAQEIDVNTLGIEIEAGASFALWLAEKLPSQFGGNNSLSPPEAYRLLQETLGREDI